MTQPSPRQHAEDKLVDLQTRLLDLQAILAQASATLERDWLPGSFALRRVSDSAGALHEALSNDLVTVAFVGPFSSGKTLLLSALIDDIEATVDEEDGSWTWQTSLLPTDPRPTTNHPIEIRRGDALKLLVRYEGESSFKDLEATKEMIGAHVSDLYSTSRQVNEQRVAELVLETPAVPLPGRFLDLPGTQSGRAGDDELIERGLECADCFVFVLSAVRSIDSQALDQLADLHELYLIDNKPVFFALTQIDTRLNRAEDGRYAFESSRDESNQVLREVFVEPQTGHADEGFLGRGFVAVATPSHAKAKHLALLGERDRVVDAEVRLGNPLHLLTRLSDFFYRDVAPARLERLERALRDLRAEVAITLQSAIESLSAPIREIESQHARNAGHSKRVAAGRVELLETVPTAFEASFKHAFTPTAKASLEEALYNEFGLYISQSRQADDAWLERLPGLANTVATKWALSSFDSPLRRWHVMEGKRFDTILEATRNLVEYDVAWGDITAVAEDFRAAGALRLRPTRSERTDGEAARPLNDVLGAATGAIGAGTAAALAGAALFAPVVVVLGGAVVGVSLRTFRRRRIAQRESREHLLRYLEEVAQERVEAIRAVCETRVLNVVATLDAWLGTRLSLADEERRLLELRLEGHRVTQETTHSLEILLRRSRKVSEAPASVTPTG